ncbi:uncharacterized protein LOC6727052 isoform X1 [Drosophila simulans]|uniref:GD19500 n=2 Tax=Drosophila simulans TaxID=7240 RepID=B4QZ12_DROSI|nr:uncharacterized protein LOC6727052 isoform X1 [Drosophila simulans]EDX11952.1 GD19500 [Drosophila simulans]KMZ01958.1 uncharacterized protein Dsimw501_GD19500 [Drosophila simulans]
METPVEEHGMDLSKVSVVRSAKGVDMLCVDDYLYHFDRIGRNNTYRWLCNRRKDKSTPCKSRICTMLPDPLDKTRHVVVDVVLAHIHPRCSDHEVNKVAQRKRLSVMMMNDAYSTTQPKRARLYERANAGMNPPEFIYGSIDSSTVEASFQLDFEDKDRVYMLRRRDGRVMVCIDGHLYYLAGKSYKGDIFRWTCVRKRDIECTARICTEATLAGAHRLHAVDTDAHIHPHYSAAKLMHMFSKHQIVLVEDENTSDVLAECPNLEYFDPENTFDTAQRGDDLESIIIEECEDNYDIYMRTDGSQGEGIQGNEELESQEGDDESSLLDPKIHHSSKWPAAFDVIANYLPPPSHNPLTETDLTKFTFLPSAKGRKVLCLSQHLFHFDSQSRSNGHMFFTCINRRDKANTCHVRITLDPLENGPVVLRINGEHTHDPDIKEIARRLKQQAKLDQDNAHKLQKIEHAEEISFESDEGSASQGGDTFEAENSVDESYEPIDTRNVVMKKVISIDGAIKMEPESKANMIVQYLKDGANNISAKIEILPDALDELEPHAAYASTPLPKVRQPQITNIRRRRDVAEPAKGAQPDMDLSKICTLRSAKGHELLCVDGYIYHAKNRGVISRNYWVCIKSRDPDINCKSRISTATQKDGSIRVLRVYNSHSHPFSEDDIKRRLYNEINKKNNKNLKFRPLHFIGKSLDQIQQEFGDLAIERLNVSNISSDIVVHKKPRISGSNNSRSVSQRADSHHEDDDVVIVEEEYQEQEEGVEMTMEGDQQYVDVDNTDGIIEVVEEVADEMEGYGSIVPIYTMKLYAVSDGPPSLAVRMCLKALDIQYQLINVDFCAMEHRSEEYSKINPQKEIPVLDDDGFYLSESIAIMQYLCDKYAPDSTLYPQDVNVRAVINQRLCFNMGFYYAPISAHSMAPIFFDYKRTPMSLKKVQNALEVFETYLERLGTKYAAGDNITIADFALISATICLEAINFDLQQYPLVNKWYETFKVEYPQLWEIANSGMQEISAFEQNPPDLSHMEHPFHPTRKSKGLK